MFEELILPEIRELLESKDSQTLQECLSQWLPPDVAGVIERLDDHEEVELFSLLTGKFSVEVFGYLDRAVQHRLMDLLPKEQSIPLLNEMRPDDRTALLESLSESARGQLLALLSPKERDVAQGLLTFPVDSVGRLMTPDFIAIKREWTVEEVLAHVRVHGKDSETLNVLYVTDERGRLLDDIRVREFLLAPLNRSVEAIMDGQFIALRALDDRAAAVAQFRRYDRTALPVVDEDGILVGIVTVDDVLDVAEENATREIQQFGGLEALDDSYNATPLFEMIRKRASWLVILFLGEMLTATAMGFFEEEIERAVILALFVPLIISSGGNSGGQAATLIIRALALGEVGARDWFRVMQRELVSGFALGSILGSIGFLRIAIWSLFSDIYGPHWILVGMTVSLSLVAIVVWGTLSGSMLPFALRRAGFDPAKSSAPFVATLVDVTGLIIYFSIAAVVLRGTLL